MDLTQLTLETFMCAGCYTCAPADPNAFFVGAAVVAPLVGAKLRDLGHGYALYRLGAEAGDIALCLDGELVGFYQGEMIAVHPDHKGKRLAVSMVLAAAVARPMPTKRIVSPEGDAALRRAWRVANGLEPNPWPQVLEQNT